jgi:hypothetical protein
MTTRASKRPRCHANSIVPSQSKRTKKSVHVAEDGRQCLPYLQERVPTEVLVHIFSFLRERELSRVSQVCRRFREVGELQSLWRNLFHRVFEMDSAYTHPTSDTKSPSSPLMDLNWKEQFSLMVRTLLLTAVVHLFTAFSKNCTRRQCILHK